MIQIQEIKNEYSMIGQNAVLVKGAIESFLEWQATHPEADIINVQKVESGLFVVYKKKVEERIENRIIAGKKK